MGVEFLDIAHLRSFSNEDANDFRGYMGVSQNWGFL